MSSEEVSGTTDANLVVAIACWRQEALAEAYRRHGGGVFGLARHLVGDAENAKDIAQGFFLRLWGTVKSRIRSGLRPLRLS